MNVPPTIGRAISGRPELLDALTTTMGLEDLHDVLEVLSIDAHNQRVINKRREQD